MKKLMLALISFYQKQISPRTQNHCKYYPSCSTYAKEAIEKYGAIKGGLMAVYRILRCNPWSKGGYDPVDKE